MYELLWLIIWVGCGIFIYSDATKRQLKNPYSWAIMGILLGVIGIMGYRLMIIRPNKTSV